APNPEWVWMRSPVRMREAEMMARRLGASFLPPERVSPEGLVKAIEEAIRMRPRECEDGAIRLAQIISSWARG
ncbi:MAG: hypothetical protein RXO24_10820, partial [Acidilobus sp.]